MHGENQAIQIAMWYVEIQFVSGPTFSVRVNASSKAMAESLAMADAKIMGFTSRIKKIITRERVKHLSSGGGCKRA